MGSLNFNLDKTEFNEVFKKRIENLAEDIFVDSQQNIIQQTIVDEGTLLNSGKVTHGDNFSEVRYDALYSDIIEFGRSPGTMPPSSALEGWVKRKLGITKPSEIKSVAFLIARDIKTRGQQPRPYLGPAVEKQRLKLK